MKGRKSGRKIFRPYPMGEGSGLKSALRTIFLPIPHSPFPIPHFPFPVPYSLFSKRNLSRLHLVKNLIH